MQFYKFNSNVASRYESHINEGMYFLFNVKNGDIWTGNTSSYVLLNNFKSKMSVEDAVKLSAQNFDIGIKDLEINLSKLAEELAKKGFLDSYDK